MSDRELVKNCMRRILKQLGFETDAAGQRSLEYLCDQVYNKTGVQLSLSTAKRLLNGQFTKLPQSATLNAIAQFLGYTDWQHYKQQQLTRETVPADILANTKQKTVEHAYKKFSWIVVVFLAGMTLALIAFLNRNKKETKTGSVFLRAEKTTANHIPNTVVFHFNVDDVEADSFFIQQSWDKDRRVKVHKGQYTLTDIYYEPGYHVAKLIADNQVIKTFDVSIPTNGWFYYTKERGPASLPEYIVRDENRNPGITQEDVVKNKISADKEKLYISVYFPQSFKISSDDFVFKARVKRVALRNDFCPLLMLEVFCQRNFMFIQSVQPGCSSNAIAQFGENFLDGKTHDLSPLSTTVDDWHDYEISVKNKVAGVYIDKKKVFETSYNQSSGMITGIGFISNGLCEIEDAELKGNDGNIFYSFKTK